LRDSVFRRKIHGSNHWPRISVITPSYNQAPFLEETIQSVLFQGYPNLEYIIIDGGSEDESVEIIKRYEKHLSYWHSEKDKGQADAINQGMRLSTGEVVCWLNSDDLYLPGTLMEVGRRFLGETEQCRLIYGSAFTAHQTEREIQGGSRVAGNFDAEALTYSDYIVQPSTFWTRKLWLEVGELNVEYHYVLDWEWFIRASKITEFEHVLKFLSIYRLHPLHKTRSGGLQRIREINEIVKRHAPASWRELYKIVFARHQRILETRRLLMRMRIPGSSYLLPLLFPSVLFKEGSRSRVNLLTVLYMYGLD
jgi:glycosyltransferase involved in cell wall biosynthesis